MATRWLALALLSPLPALAGIPGDGDPIVSVVADGITDSEARSPLGLGAEVRAAIPLHEHETAPDLDLRLGLVHSTVPTRDAEAFMRENPWPEDAATPDSIRFSRWEARLHALASWGATSREESPRVRAGVVGLLDGTAGADKQLGPIGWTSDYTRALRLGPTAAVGWAVPLGDELGDPLLDVRIGGSVLIPIAAGGGLLATDPDAVLVVPSGCAEAGCDTPYGRVSVVGRETRAFAEGTFTVERLVVGLELGLEHNARSAIARARSASPEWEVVIPPEKADPYVRLSAGWMF